MAYCRVVNILFCFFVGVSDVTWSYKLVKNDEKCPEVKARSNCDLDSVRMCFFSVTIRNM